MDAEKSSGSVEISSTPPKESEVSCCEVPDCEVAASLMDEVIGQRGIRESIKSMLERAYRELSKRSPSWTRRRVRAVFYREAGRIEHREIAEMQAVVAARKRHAEYRKETARRAQMAVVRAQAENGGMASGEGG